MNEWIKIGFIVDQNFSTYMWVNTVIELTTQFVKRLIISEAKYLANHYILIKSIF
jgi:hypothetical protein